MKLKNEKFAGQKFAFGQEVLEVSGVGEIEVKDPEVAQILLKEGWQLLESVSKAEPKADKQPVVETKKPRFTRKGVAHDS